jgi:NADPH:quinone reductase-like Zn-dependent oxidoreductase
LLELREVQKPTPQKNELLIRVHATTVTSGDARIRSATYAPWFWLPSRLMFGLTTPRQSIPGTELSGVVEATGSDVTRFSVGERVLGLSWTLGFGGTHAEYVCLPEDGMVVGIPRGVSFEEAAALPTGGLTALQFLRKASVERGQQVLIHGASGSVGTFAVQLAKLFGASVTGLCSTRNVELVASLGADEVIDYTREDFSQQGKTYDVIFDAAMKAPFSRCKPALEPEGRYVTVDFPLATAVRNWPTGRRHQIHWGTAKRKPADLEYLAKLVAAGTLKPVIDRRYPLEEAAAAHAYVDTGRKKGNVVITVE